MKCCRICGEEKSLTDYYKASVGTRDGHYHECKVCSNRKSMERHWKNRDQRLEKAKEYYYKTRYGLTKNEYDSLIESANGVCHLCNQEKDLVLDHCHSSGKIRGVICNQCNQALGSVYDNKETLNNMINYLETH